MSVSKFRRVVDWVVKLAVLVTQGAGGPVGGFI
jgi:hypothetical protein